MKKILTALLLIASINSYAIEDMWTSLSAVPVKSNTGILVDKSRLLSLQETTYKNILFHISNKPEEGIVMSLPTPDGKTRSFRVWEESMFEPGLALQCPGIKTFTAVAQDNKFVTAKLDFTYLGFHAMIFDGDNTYFIDPYTNPSQGYYICYYKHEISANAYITPQCAVADKPEQLIQHQPMQILGGKQLLKQFGTNRYAYRLAMACTGEYSVAAASGGTPSKTTSLSAIATSVNRVNGVYEREIGVHFDLVAGELNIIYTDPSSDPYTNGNSYALQTENQNNLDAIIGSINYDFGHILCTSSTGLSEKGCICGLTKKAMSVSGQPNPIGAAFDIDFIAHEMGHALNADHTFNASTGSCAGGNGVQSCAYEPGSGTTIMAYAGICGSANNTQAHSDAFFHYKSLDQISAFLTSPSGICANVTVVSNTPPTEASINQTYNIPNLTPFELIAPLAVDTDHDTLTYDWEEWDLGDFGANFSATKVGPIFRSFVPSFSNVRIFPTLDSLRRDVKNYLGEKLPDVDRTMKFKLTVRDIFNGYGTTNQSDNELNLNVTTSSGPFKVIFPNTTSDYLQSGTQATITWDVANTTAAPVSCANVDIYLSTDDGITFPYTLASATANDGSETVAIPANIYAAGCRVKVKGSGNVFFDMSNQNFSIFPWPAGVGIVEAADGFKVYPIPAKTQLNIQADEAANYSVAIVNTLGVTVYENTMAINLTVQTNGLSSGVYYLRLKNTDTGKLILKKVVIE